MVPGISPSVVQRWGVGVGWREEVRMKQGWLELTVVMWGLIMLFAFVMFEIFHNKKLKERRKAGRLEGRKGGRKGVKERRKKVLLKCPF